MEELQRAIGVVGFALVVGAYVTGLVLLVAGRILRRSFWKIGVRLQAGSVVAAGIVGGLVILTVPFWRFGDAWWIVFLTAPLGVLTTAIGVVSVRRIARMAISETGEADRMR